MTSVVFSVGVWLPGGGMGNHAYNIIQGLDRHGLLARAFVMLDKSTGLTPGNVRDAYLLERIAYRLARYTHCDQYVLRDNLFDAWVSTRLPQANIFYSWTHHALWSLRAAHRKGMITVVERANAHPLTYQRLLHQEYARRGLTPRTYPHHPWAMKKLLRELDETDFIAVTSQFTKQSLLEHGIAETRILLTPLGVDTTHYVPAATPPPDDTFRVVYVGQICIRKGIHYLLDAWQRLGLKQAELILVGDVVAELQADVQCALAQNSTITLRPYADDPVPVYQEATICICPTLEDGFGLVVLEAMACGVPVIITAHTGAKDCVRPNLDGFIIPPYSAEAIADTLAYCSQHRATLHAMGRQARQQAEQFPWARYQDGIVQHVQRIR